MSKSSKNIAYIDGQNLHMGTTKAKSKWAIDLAKFRIYLKDKYRVKDAYYYLGYVRDGSDYESLYELIQKAGFILKFREHSSTMLGKKKGNVDCDIVFSVMKRIYLKEDFDNIVLVSGDGDYKMLVDFLIDQDKFAKILFPDGKRRSSLYKSLDIKYSANLDNPDLKKKIGQKK